MLNIEIRSHSNAKVLFLTPTTASHRRLSPLLLFLAPVKKSKKQWRFPCYTWGYQHLVLWRCCIYGVVAHFKKAVSLGLSGSFRSHCAQNCAISVCSFLVPFWVVSSVSVCVSVIMYVACVSLRAYPSCRRTISSPLILRKCVALFNEGMRIFRFF